MDRKTRAFMYLAFAGIDFFLFKGTGMRALGLVFLVVSIKEFVALRKAG